MLPPTSLAFSVWMLTLTEELIGKWRSLLCVRCNEILTINDVTEIESVSSTVVDELLMFGASKQTPWPVLLYIFNCSDRIGVKCS